MLKKLYLSILLFVACSNISAMEKAKQQIPAPVRKKLEIIRPSQRITQEDALPSPTVVAQPISQAITQRVEPEVSRIAPVATHSIRQNQYVRECIRVDATLVNYHTGANVRYYNEYHAQPEGDTNIVSFPLNCCDPLPIRNCGSIRYFFPSAISSHMIYPVSITDPEINKVIVIRAKNDCNSNHSEVYIGYNPDCYVSDRGNRIYDGKILLIQTKNIRSVEIRQTTFAGVGGVSDQEIIREVRKYLQDPRDFSWNSPVFQKIIIELMGPLESGIVWNNQSFYSTICYWTQDENKLKGIHYRH